MNCVLREVVRQYKRAWIRECTFISYQMDDRDGMMVIRFRVDVPFQTWDTASAVSPGEQAAKLSEASLLQMCARKGIIGVRHLYSSNSMEELTGDYVTRVVDVIIKAIREFCTPLGGEVDEELFQKCCTAARQLSVDGALLATGIALKAKHMQNVLLICRDAAHAVRIAVKEPVIRTNGFAEVYRNLFEKKHAILKDIQYSNKLQARLSQCQELIVKSRGSQGASLQTIIENFSFAPQRFESFSEPIRKWVCTLLANLLMLASIATYDKSSDMRKTAVEGIEFMTGENILRAALAGDWAELGLMLIRLFDAADRDPCTEVRDLRNYEEKSRNLFIKGNILDVITEKKEALMHQPLLIRTPSQRLQREHLQARRPGLMFRRRRTPVPLRLAGSKKIIPQYLDRSS